MNIKLGFGQHISAGSASDDDDASNCSNEDDDKDYYDDDDAWTSSWAFVNTPVLALSLMLMMLVIEIMTK